MHTCHDDYNSFSIVIQGVILLSATPQSRNVSASTLVEFTCATPDPETGLTSFIISADVILVNTTSNDVILPNGDRQLTLSFIVPSEYQLITIACIATRINMGMVDINTSTAILMIQGETAFKLCPLYSRQHHREFTCCVFCLIDMYYM